MKEVKLATLDLVLGIPFSNFDW